MGRRLQLTAVVLAIAALAGGALGGCLCPMPQAAVASHDCCDAASPVISAGHDCCGGGTASNAPVVLVAALNAAPTAGALAAPPALPVALAASPAASLAAATPALILRI